MSEDKDAEIARLEAEIASALRHTDRLAACVSEGDGVIRRLYAEVAALRKELDEDRNELILHRVAVKTWMVATGEAESRLSALAAAARAFREAERSLSEKPLGTSDGLDIQIDRFNATARALDALLSGEEGR